MSAEAPKRPQADGRARLRAHATTSGMLLASMAIPLGIVQGTTSSVTDAPRWLQASGAGAAALLLLASLVITRLPKFGRFTATLGIVIAFGLALPFFLASPLLALAGLIATTTALTLLWKVGAPLISLNRLRRRALYEGQAQGAGIMALAIWSVWTFTDMDKSLLDTLSVGWAIVCCTLLAGEWALRNISMHRLRASVVLTAIVGSGAFAPVFWGNWRWMMSILTGSAIASAALVRRPPRIEMEQTDWWEPLLGHPERLFVGTFAALCMAGTALLALPQSATSDQSIGFLDAAFTSTSAVCVTGLVVLDTARDFSGFGQFVILLLIQVGGLGIMTFSTMALRAFGRRMSLRHEGAMASLISTQDRSRLFATAKHILQLTLVSEGLGAATLAIAFMLHGDGFLAALWRGTFTAISAFCNAGFALQSNSLEPYQQSALVLNTVGLLIILGGLSPLAVFSLPAIVRRSSEPASAQARLALATAAVLLVTGFFFILTFEWNDSLAGLSYADRLSNAWFLSVTLRTAGFNSVDIAHVRPATLTLMLLWMFIGGSPGGTAGGVKTTTIAVLVLSVVHAIRGHWTIEAFGKRIAEQTRARASVIVAVAATTGLVALVGIQLTQKIPTHMAVFEVVSALGTVGLSIGGTARLDGVGRAIIVACMFVGRVGGVSLLMFLSSRRRHPPLGRPEEEIDVG